jgi:ribonuclease P protein component
LPLLETLKRRADFLALNAGTRVAKPGFVLLGRPRPNSGEGPSRLGLTVSRKNGNAVARNRIRRRLRSLARAALSAKGVAGWDYVLIAREAALRRNFTLLQGDLESALEMLHKAAQGPRAGTPSRNRRKTGSGS